MVYTLFLELISIFDESFQDLEHLAGIIEPSGVNKSICCIQALL